MGKKFDKLAAAVVDRAPCLEFGGERFCAFCSAAGDNPHRDGCPLRIIADERNEKRKPSVADILAEARLFERVYGWRPKWIAMDIGGEWCGYRVDVVERDSYWYPETGDANDYERLPGEPCALPTNIDWKRSLIEVPPDPTRTPSEPRNPSVADIAPEALLAVAQRVKDEHGWWPKAFCKNKSQEGSDYWRVLRYGVVVNRPTATLWMACGKSGTHHWEGERIWFNIRAPELPTDIPWDESLVKVPPEPRRWLTDEQLDAIRTLWPEAEYVVNGGNGSSIWIVEKDDDSLGSISFLDYAIPDYIVKYKL